MSKTNLRLEKLGERMGVLATFCFLMWEGAPQGGSL